MYKLCSINIKYVNIFPRRLNNNHEVIYMNKENNQKEMPIGLAMSLALNEFAMEYYAGLDDEIHDQITKYVQNSNSGKEAKEKINTVVRSLSKRNTNFLR